MCGIVGYVGARCAQNVLLDGLTKLEYRGYDSAGLALSVGGGIRVIKSKGRLTALRARLEEATAAGLPAAHCGIGHTRWATHGEPSDVNSHPHSTPYVSIVHNGIIENYGALKAVLEAKGYTFVSETDTEVLVKLIDSCYHGEPLRALTQALARVRGSYALAVLFRDWPDTMFAVRRESPLIVGYGEGENFLASDIPAILRYTRRYSVLEEGDMVVCKAGSVQIYDEFGRAVQREKLTADWDIEAAEKGGYPHFMLKEINEQPAATTAVMRCTRSTSRSTPATSRESAADSSQGRRTVSQSSCSVTGGRERFAPFVSTAVIRTSPSPSRGARPPSSGPCCGRRCRAGSGSPPAPRRRAPGA